MEPLPALLACLRHLTRLRQQQQQDLLGSDATTAQLEGAAAAAGADPTDAAGWLQASTGSCLSRLLLCSLEDFGLDRGCGWNPGTSAGLLHQLQAAQLLGCLEVAMEGVLEGAAGG